MSVNMYLSWVGGGGEGEDVGLQIMYQYSVDSVQDMYSTVQQMCSRNIIDIQNEPIFQEFIIGIEKDAK